MTKYRAQKTECSFGHIHDSKLEAKRCNELSAMLDAGEIADLEYQPTFPVSINGKYVCKYVADFSWMIGDCRIIEDAKGMTTPVFNLKKKLVEAIYPGVVITLYPPRKRKTRKKA